MGKGNGPTYSGAELSKLEAAAAAALICSSRGGWLLEVYSTSELQVSCHGLYD